MRPEPPDGTHRQENHGPGGGTAPGLHLSGGAGWGAPELARGAENAATPERAAPCRLVRAGGLPTARPRAADGAGLPSPPLFGPAEPTTRAARAGPPPGCTREKTAPPRRRGRAGTNVGVGSIRDGAPGCGCAVCRAATAAGIPFFVCQALGPADMAPGGGAAFSSSFSDPAGARGHAPRAFGPRPLRPSTTAGDLLRRRTIEGRRAEAAPPRFAWAAGPRRAPRIQNETRDLCRSEQKSRVFSFFHHVQGRLARDR